MAAIEVKDKAGKVVGSAELPGVIAGAEPVVHLLHAAVVAEEANKRQGTQKTKTRSETRGGGRKPYKQKKTGNARQGSTRAPHYAHGGMALALSPRSYEKKLNKRERRAAILGALNSKFAAGHVIVAEKIAFTEPRTKHAIDMLKALGVEEEARILVVIPEVDEITHKCFRNLPNVVVRTAPVSGTDGEDAPKSAAFSTRDVLVARKLIVAKDALDRIQEVWSK